MGLALNHCSSLSSPLKNELGKSELGCYLHTVLGNQDKVVASVSSLVALLPEVNELCYLLGPHQQPYQILVTVSPKLLGGGRLR